MRLSALSFWNCSYAAWFYHTARYVDVRLERKKEVLDAYHGAVKQAAPPKDKETEPKKAKSAAKKKSSDLEL